MKPIKYVYFSLALLCMSSLSVPLNADVYVVQPRSGYSTKTEIVGSKEVFERHQFTPNDFNDILPMLYRAQAIEQFLELSNKGIISTMGTVQIEKLIIGTQIYTKGQVISFDDIEDNTPPNYTTNDLYTALINAQVLDSSGFVAGLQTGQNIEFSPVNFSVYFDRIKKIPLPLLSQQAQAGILNEVNALIISRHRAIEVVTHQSTSYRSKSTNLFNGLVETMSGNWLASVFSPDKTNITRTDINYLPQINLYGYYPLWAGFTPYPHFGGVPGRYIINGNLTEATSEAEFMNGKDGNMIELTKSYAWTFGKHKPPFVGALSYTKLAFRYLQVQSPDTMIFSRFYSISIPFFILPNASLSKHLDFNMIFGPTYSTNPTRNALGLHVGARMTIPIFTYTDLDMSIIAHSQPGREGANTWDQNNAYVGLQYSGISQFTFKTGIHWLHSSSDVSTFGLGLGVTYTGF